MKILVLGAKGRLGTALLLEGAARGLEMEGLTHPQLDICDGDAVAAALEAHRPDWVLNTVAYNLVDAAEGDPAPAYLVNAKGAANVARSARRVGARACFVSTDYVFDGKSDRPYREEDETGPLGHYGLSKLAGEALTRWRGGEDTLVVRTAVVYGPHRHAEDRQLTNFVEGILSRVDSGAELVGVEDQVVSPTYTPVLASWMLDLVAAEARGLFHVAGAGACSRLELMQAILDEFSIDAPVRPATQASFAAPAARPIYSALSSEKAGALIGRTMPTWRESLARYREERQA